MLFRSKYIHFFFQLHLRQLAIVIRTIIDFLISSFSSVAQKGTGPNLYSIVPCRCVTVPCPLYLPLTPPLFVFLDSLPFLNPPSTVSFFSRFSSYLSVRCFSPSFTLRVLSSLLYLRIFFDLLYLSFLFSLFIPLSSSLYIILLYSRSRFFPPLFLYVLSSSDFLLPYTPLPYTFIIPLYCILSLFPSMLHP